MDDLKLAERAKELHKQGKLSEAVEAWQRIVEIAPSYPFHFVLLGAVLFDIGKAERSPAHMRNCADAFTRACELFKEHADTHPNVDRKVMSENIAREETNVAACQKMARYYSRK